VLGLNRMGTILALLVIGAMLWLAWWVAKLG